MFLYFSWYINFYSKICLFLGLNKWTVERIHKHTDRDSENRRTFLFLLANFFLISFLLSGPKTALIEIIPLSAPKNGNYSEFDFLNLRIMSFWQFFVYNFPFFMFGKMKCNELYKNLRFKRRGRARYVFYWTQRILVDFLVIL